VLVNSLTFPASNHQQRSQPIVVVPSRELNPTSFPSSFPPLRLISRTSGKLSRVISGHLGWVRAVAVEPGNQWFATGAGDRVIKVWDLASGELKVSLTGHISTVRGLAVSPRHPYLFSAGEDKVSCFSLVGRKWRVNCSRREGEEGKDGGRREGSRS